MQEKRRQILLIFFGFLLFVFFFFIVFKLSYYDSFERYAIKNAEIAVNRYCEEYQIDCTGIAWEYIDEFHAGANKEYIIVYFKKNERADNYILCDLTVYVFADGKVKIYPLPGYQPRNRDDEGFLYQMEKFNR